jgi:integrase/recombinase XerD
MPNSPQKTVRKYSRRSTSRKKLDTNQLTLTTMFERFMIFKETEGLTQITLKDYQKHFQYLLKYTNGDIAADGLLLKSIRTYNV